MNDLHIRRTTGDDLPTVLLVLQEAVEWLEQIGQPLWLPEEVSQEAIARDVVEGNFVIFEKSGQSGGVFRFDLQDEIFWPEDDGQSAAYVHRLAIRRVYAGSGLSSAMIDWAIAEAQRHGRRFLRLDCEAHRPKLRAVYEKMGFSHVDDRELGGFFVSRMEIETDKRD